MPECPICASSVQQPKQDHFFSGYDCPRCGRWSLPADSAGAVDLLRGKLGDWDAFSIHLRSHLSHIVRRQQRNDGGWVQVPLDLETWHLEQPLPNPAEQLDRLVIAIGDHQPSAAESTQISADELSATIGATITRKSNNAGLGWILEQADAKSSLEDRGAQGAAMLLRLRMAGWTRYETLKRAKVESHKVLIAMQFNDPELNRVVEECFRPAVAHAGFELRTLNEKQSAGLIDDQLRVALRTSQFILADLTHGNNGAYWESGFVEGMGRPVIYTCRKKEWDVKKTHFDTSHLVTVVWDANKLADASVKITATIRATLPSEAKMNDD